MEIVNGNCSPPLLSQSMVPFFHTHTAPPLLWFSLMSQEFRETPDINLAGQPDIRYPDFLEIQYPAIRPYNRIFRWHYIFIYPKDVLWGKISMTFVFNWPGNFSVYFSELLDYDIWESVVRWVCLWFCNTRKVSVETKLVISNTRSKLCCGTQLRLIHHKTYTLIWLDFISFDLYILSTLSRKKYTLKNEIQLAHYSSF